MKIPSPEFWVKIGLMHAVAESLHKYCKRMVGEDANQIKDMSEFLYDHLHDIALLCKEKEEEDA